MKLKKIKSLKDYKSFQEFSWNRYFNSDLFHEDVNILFGENGSGKSSICTLLKSICGLKEIDKYKPKEACLVFDKKEHKYISEDSSWDHSLEKSDILFFDREFVHTNVHLGHKRGTQQGEQEQESGKMIIEFDSEAIHLRSIRDKLKLKREKSDEVEKEYRVENNDRLTFNLNEEDEKIFESHNKKSKEELKKLKTQLDQEFKKLQTSLLSDIASESKSSEIQSINLIEEIPSVSNFSDYETYQSVFDFDLKDEIKKSSEDTLITKIKQNKEFFQSGINLREEHPKQCPFCQSSEEEENVKKILDLYNNIYDDTYNIKKIQFDENRDSLCEEIRTIIDELKNLNLNELFLSLKDIEEKFKITNIYSIEIESQYKKPKTNKLKNILDKLLILSTPNSENINILYVSALKEFEEINEFFSRVNKLIIDKNIIIGDFKSDNTSTLLSKRISENTIKKDCVENEINFINQNKINLQKEKEKAISKLESLELESKKAKEDFRKARLEYEDYCSNEAFSSLLTRIESYFKKFNFSFTISIDTERRLTGSTKEFPFAFKVLDSDGHERDLKEGLSEGELQVLSLCFFFSFLDIQDNKQNKILVFDDPITSLDNNNLSCLVDLISEERTSFSQTFIFTHHKTFFQFLKKKMKKFKSYNILRNSQMFGGSFICRSKTKKFIPKLKDFEKHLIEIPPQALDVESKIVEYGQYLRYEIERYIKNDLLYWDVQVFSNIIDGIKNTKNISDDDLDKISNIYSFCNWTTSHVSTGDDHGLSQLKVKINEFIKIVS